MIFIIVEDDARVLYILCKLLWEKTSKTIAIHCGQTNDEISLKKIISLDDKKVKLWKVADEDKLIDESLFQEINNLAIKDDIRVILDITLSEKPIIEKNKTKIPYKFNDFGSVKFASFLVNKTLINSDQVIFYSRSFARDVYVKTFIKEIEDQHWRVPIERPCFGAMDESKYINEFFIPEIMRPINKV